MTSRKVWTMNVINERVKLMLNDPIVNYANSYLYTLFLKISFRNRIFYFLLGIVFETNLKEMNIINISSIVKTLFYKLIQEEFAPIFRSNNFSRLNFGHFIDHKISYMIVHAFTKSTN